MNEKYAFIIGKGDLPYRLIEVALNNKLNFVIAGIKSYSPRLLVNKYDHFWFHMGCLNDLLNNLSSRGIKKVVIVGSINRPSLLSLKVDDLGKEFVKKFFSQIGGDDSLLKIVYNFFIEQGIECVPIQSIDPSILAQEKLYTNVVPKEENIEDIIKGFKTAKELSKLDIGQSIIFQQNIVISVEAVENTKAMILRSKKLIKKNNPKALLVKTSKVNQNMFLDVPTIGDKTILQAKKVNLAGIVIEAGKTIILNQEKTVALANKYNIFLIALKHNNLDMVKNLL